MLTPGKFRAESAPRHTCVRCVEEKAIVADRDERPGSDILDFMEQFTGRTRPDPRETGIDLSGCNR